MFSHGRTGARAATPTVLAPDLAGRLARLALGHVTREYPHKLDHVVEGPEDVRTPRELHPVFHGSFDWHSCVHGCWMLARLLRRVPGLGPAAEVRDRFDARLPYGDPRHARLEDAAARHLAAGLPHVAGHYAGEHRLASLAVLALEPVTLGDCSRRRP